MKPNGAGSRNTVSPVLFLKSFLTAYALCVVFHAPLIPGYYETGLDYLIASVYELLGDFDFKFILTFILCFFFYRFLAGRAVTSGKPAVFLSVFFSVCLLIGQSYHEIGSWDYCFGSIVNFIHFSLAVTGYSFLFFSLISLFRQFLDSRQFTTDQPHFFSKHAFIKAFLIIQLAWLPFVILSFPGTLCWDVIGQIQQVLGEAPYSTHHPLIHTLLIGAFLKTGQCLFHSPETGLFLYILFQYFLLSAALAATIAVLAKRNARFSLLLTLLLLYCITPAYSNAVSTALKDVPFCAFVIGYVICLSELHEKPELLRNIRFLICFVLMQAGVILMRNNGLYVILLSGIGSFIFLYRKYNVRERFLSFFSSFAGSILICQLLLALAVQLCSAAPGSRGEMLSVPFQQTARYLQSYDSELSEQERSAIEAVLGNTSVIADSYDPDLADPVKQLFKKDASGKELLNYFRVWFRCFFKHPGVYSEAFFAHVYGWFTPSVKNGIRYEAVYDKIGQGLLFPSADKILIFYYRFAGCFTPLGILENTGLAVWALFFLTFYQKHRKQSAACCSGLPLWVSLLVCMASPCFFNHPRYAFPILFCLPFLYGFTLTQSENSLKGLH